MSEKTFPRKNKNVFLAARTKTVPFVLRQSVQIIVVLEILFRLCHIVNGREGIGDAVVNRDTVERSSD